MNFSFWGRLIQISIHQGPRAIAKFKLPALAIFKICMPAVVSLNLKLVYSKIVLLKSALLF